MTIYYKSVRYIDGKMRWVITDEDDNIINKVPSRDELKVAIPDCGKSQSRFKGRKCYRCGSKETYMKNNGRPDWRRDVIEKNRSSDKFLCSRCFGKDYQNLPNSQNNIIKSMRQCRTGQLDIYSETGEGLIIEAIVAKVRKLKVLSIELDNFVYKSDISNDLEYGISEIKGPKLDNNGRWVAKIGSEHNFDTLFVVCMDRNRNYIDRIYIVPESELYGYTYIEIYEDWSGVLRMEGSKFEWIEEFRINDEIRDIYNDCYHNLMFYLKDRETFGIDNIKDWLNK